MGQYNQAGTQVNNDTVPNIIDRIGRDGDELASKLHGDYFEQNRRGNLWMYTTGSGTIAPAINTATTPTWGLWNKSTNYYLELVELIVGQTTATSVIGGLGWALVPSAGIAVATGAPISAFTELATTLKMSTFTQANAPNGKVATTLTAINPGATYFIPIGFNNIITPLTTTANPTWVHSYRGDLLVPPQCAILLCNSVAASAAINFSISWIDNVPV
jgi:hypothetical protein